MQNDINHWCKVCGTGYYACNDCNKTENWKAAACCPDHYQIYTALIFYNRGHSNKEQTAAFLKSLGVTPSKMVHFLPDVREQLQELLTADTQTVSKQNKKARK